MKRLYKIFATWFLCLFLVLSQFIVSFADVKSLMIGSDSNALMTLELDDTDYMLMSPRSSVGTVSNTVNGCIVEIGYTNGTYQNYFTLTPDYVNKRYKFTYGIPDYLTGYWINTVRFTIQSEQLKINYLPRPSGNYSFSMDFASDFAYEDFFHLPRWASYYQYENSVISNVDVVVDSYQFSSGDLYISALPLKIGSGYYLNQFRLAFTEDHELRNFGGSFALRFDPIDFEGANLAGSNISSSEIYNDSVSSSLSDLSSSVDSMSDEISGVTEAIQNLQGAMEPHYSNVLTQLHHITEQLHAFYDQIYNNIHLKEYALWQDIKTAIENIDLEVNVNLDKLKTSIDNMSQAIQNKLQSVQDTLTNGFDNSGINQDAAELDQSLQEYEEAEQTVIDQVNDSLNDFEFDSGFEEYTNTIKVFSDFIQDLYEASGGFKVVINLSLMLSIAGIVIGVYRFRDGG